MPTYASLKVMINDRLATVVIDHGKVNAIDTTLSRDLEAAFLALEDNGEVDGVVLAGKPHCFCAGLNVVTLATSDTRALREFFSAYLSALQAMVRFSKPFVAAVTGFAPAGGTIIALTSDYRVMARGEKHTVGMNEFNMSLQIPKMMGEIFAYYVGEARAWVNVQRASMYTADEAIALGLINEAAATEEVLQKAEAHCRKLMRIHPPVYKRTKRYLRRGLREVVDHSVEEMVDTIEEDFNDPEFKRMMAMFVASLSPKK